MASERKLAPLILALVLAGATGGLHAPALAGQDITHGGVQIVHRGDGVFLVGPSQSEAAKAGLGSPGSIDLKRIRHRYDPAMDPDVPAETNVTLNDKVPRLVDSEGRPYALITLYQVDPPLADLPSIDPGVDRGIDMRDPADMVKSAYSNYVSPVVTDDAERRPVPSHPIGHFFVEVELAGYPTLLTGMTTTRRADEELSDLTLGRQLGIGGVLLTPQPGRLNAAAEAYQELQLRQRQLRVIDGRFYRAEGTRNVGPEYIVRDGNVVFARFKLPEANVKDALAAFVEFLWRGEHNLFGSLISRPHKGTGGGCTPFAMMWLKASGVIPFVIEPESGRAVDDPALGPDDAANFWRGLFRTAYIPWSQIGCDERVGAAQTFSAEYTIYDLLFHDETATDLISALPGLAEMLRKDYGAIPATLFSFGALTPLRTLFIAMKRRDPGDTGNYGWAPKGEGLKVSFWDNARFSDWIKLLWTTAPTPPGIELSREGRFLGITVDAMDTPRQEEPYFAAAERIRKARERGAAEGTGDTSCRDVFLSGLQ